MLGASTVRGISQRVWAGPLVVAIVALLSVLLTLDPGANWHRTFEGPGITLDESFNVQMGVFLTEAISQYGTLLLIDPLSTKEIFETPGYNPDHPPLGRLWLGVFHDLARRYLGSSGVVGDFVTLAARTGSAVAFAITVFVIGLFTSRHFGRLAGFVAAMALVMMPRLFGHAHLASLETVLNLVWSLAVLTLAHAATRRTACSSTSTQETRRQDQPTASTTGLSLRAAVVAGVLLGAVALTKIQFVLLPPTVIVWAIWHWRLKAIKPLAVWGGIGAAVFWIFWPWLWLKVPDNLLTFLGRSTDRVPLKCYYFGTVYTDTEVPWHYPLVLFVTTLPVGLLVLGGLGIKAHWRSFLSDPRLSLLMLTGAGPLVLFSTSVAVYDGERLFLPSFLSWAVFVGLGTVELSNWLHAQVRRPRLAMAVVLMLCASGLIGIRPYWLSYYGGSIGGLRGASRLGLEVDYWGQAFSRSFWQRLSRHVPDNTILGISPSLHTFHAREVHSQNAVCIEHGWQFEPFDVRHSKRRFVIVFERRADRYSDAELRNAGYERIEVVERQGVVIGALWEARGR